MRYHHIVFDVDGTLLDTEEAILQSFQKTLREHAGIEKDLSELSFCLGITGAAALKRLETGHEEEILLQWKENLAALRDFVRVFDGIELLLKRLRADGFQLGVVTSRCRAEYERDFMRLGLDGYFDTVVCEEDTVCHKPEAEPLECYMRRAGARPEELAERFRSGPLAQAAALGAARTQPDSGPLTEFERLCDNAVTGYLASASRVPFGEETVIAYLYAKEAELTAIRTILAGRRAGLDGAVIRERLRETYV